MDILVDCGISSSILWLYNPSNPSDTYQAYCADDGWTLAMKIDGTSNTFLYDSNYWTDNQLLNADTSNMDVMKGIDAKFKAFTTVPGVAVRLMMRKSVSGSGFGKAIDLYTNTFESLSKLFAGPKITTDASKDD